MNLAVVLKSRLDGDFVGDTKQALRLIQAVVGAIMPLLLNPAVECSCAFGHHDSCKSLCKGSESLCRVTGPCLLHQHGWLAEDCMLGCGSVWSEGLLKNPNVLI